MTRHRPQSVLGLSEDVPTLGIELVAGVGGGRCHFRRLWILMRERRALFQGDENLSSEFLARVGLCDGFGHAPASTEASTMATPRLKRPACWSLLDGSSAAGPNGRAGFGPPAGETGR